jgi:hypothetical protein
MELFLDPVLLLLATAKDVLPVLGLLVLFQMVVLKRPLPRPGRIIFGFGLVLVGMACFLGGLDLALFPLGRTMALQLAKAPKAGATKIWAAYGWIYLFAFSVGFATTIAEPSLIAVSHKAEEASYKAISSFGLRIAVAIGVAVGITLGTFRIITGTPLYIYILVGYVIVAIQTFFAPRMIIPLAYDSGGVTTSTVTVPLVAALGLGLASNIPGRSPVLDGFGLIAFASLFPIISVLGYAQLAQWMVRRRNRNN